MNDVDVGPPVDPVDELLTSYLDDELTPAERTLVESRLVSDPLFSTRLHKLQQTWDALDALPRSTADQTFLQTTVGMVAASVRNESVKEVRKTQRLDGIRWFAAGGSGVLALLLSFSVIHFRAAQRNRSFLRDLPAIERMDELRLVPSVEFLKKLNDEKLFPTESDRAN